MVACDKPMYVSTPVLVLGMMVAPLGFLIGILATQDYSEQYRSQSTHRVTNTPTDYKTVQILCTMDTKVALLSGFLVMLLVGSGLLIIVDNSGESDDGQNDKPDVVVEEITEVNQRPAAYIPDVSRVWDGENSTISGYVFDESPSTY